MKKILLSFVLLLTIHVIFGQNADLLNKSLEKYGEVYFKFKPNSPKDISEITKIISIDNYKNDSVWAYANQKEFNAFLGLNIPYIVLPAPSEGINPKMSDIGNPKSIEAWDSYPTYSAYLTMMNNFAANYPSICKLYTIGTTVQGRQLLAVKISDNVNSDEAEPEFFYTSSMHGDELTGYVMMLRLIDSLLTQYGSNPRITNLVNNMEIFINPLANPDGTFHGGDNTVSGAIRYNANNVDLNRNYPDP